MNARTHRYPMGTMELTEQLTSIDGKIALRTVIFQVDGLETSSRYQYHIQDASDWTPPVTYGEGYPQSRQYTPDCPCCYLGQTHSTASHDAAVIQAITDRQETENRAWKRDRQTKIDAALTARRQIIAAGGMASKSAVEDVIMPMFGIDRCEAHEIMNEIEYKNLR